MHFIPLIFLFAPLLLIKRVLKVQRERNTPQLNTFELEHYLRLVENTSQGYCIPLDALVRLINGFNDVKGLQGSTDKLIIIDNKLTIKE